MSPQEKLIKASKMFVDLADSHVDLVWDMDAEEAMQRIKDTIRQIEFDRRSAFLTKYSMLRDASQCSPDIANEG